MSSHKFLISVTMSGPTVSFILPARHYASVVGLSLALRPSVCCPSVTSVVALSIKHHLVSHFPPVTLLLLQRINLCINIFFSYFVLLVIRKQKVPLAVWVRLGGFDKISIVAFSIGFGIKVTWCGHMFWECRSKKVKFSHTRYRALGPQLIPVYRQSARRWREVNHAIYPAVVCHCFLPGLRLPS